MAHVVIENLLKQYPEHAGAGVAAVDSINLQVNQGEFMVLVGPSGCGKSTTLRMIAGLEEISGGTISIDGRVVNDLAPKDRDIAMVFQNYALYPHMTVYENLAFGLQLRKLPREEIDRRVREAAGLLALGSYLDRKPRALSGGQRQRVAVGRAIVRQPKVFLFDEPLSNLDARMRASTRAEISKLHSRLGATMIYVTHDQVEAMTMGDRICVMNAGRIMQVAAPLELYHQPANLFVAGFIGSPSMNVFSGAFHPSAERLVFAGAEGSAIRFALPPGSNPAHRAASCAGRPVVIGIRPEDVTVSKGASAEAIEAVVDLAEPMGAETYLHLRAGEQMMIARVGPSQTFATGTRLHVTFTPDRIHIFDAETGTALP